IMRTALKTAFFLSVLYVASCDDKKDPVRPVNNISENYGSTEDFFGKNNPVVQTFTVDAAAGGSFTTAQVTMVTIKPNSLYDDHYNLVTGNVTVQFKDLYKKSDMFLSRTPTMT